MTTRYGQCEIDKCSIVQVENLGQGVNQLWYDLWLWLGSVSFVSAAAAAALEQKACCAWTNWKVGEAASYLLFCLKRVSVLPRPSSFSLSLGNRKFFKWKTFQIELLQNVGDSVHWKYPSFSFAEAFSYQLLDTVQYSSSHILIHGEDVIELHTILLISKNCFKVTRILSILYYDAVQYTNELYRKRNAQAK